ncbi:MAG: Maf family protein, partial [Lachnospiraceae bacterium]|nr:Maf family protein [Lachnospiraceae bacterium]
HQVYTGVCVICKSEEKTEESVFSEVTDIFVDELSLKEIHDYVISEEPYDKAGSYAIQGSFAKHISRICGDYNNVVGFPVYAFYKMIKEKGYIK